MGIYDRDYQRESPSYGGGMGGGGGSGRSGVVMHPRMWSVNAWLIAINCAIHLLAMTVFVRTTSTGAKWSVLHELGNFSTFDGFQRLEVWRLVTFQFLHSPDNIFHLGFNMFGLWVFGPMVEQALGGKRYLAFYLMCGIGGGLMYLILNLISVFQIPLPLALDVSTHTPLVGASAGVFGVIVACAHIAPNARVQLLFPPIPLKMSWFAYGYVAFAALNLIMGGNNAGGDAAHIGGAIAGFFFIRHPHLLADFFDVLDDSREPKDKRRRAKKPRKGPSAPDTSEVDRILDKVSREGIQSLTSKEKKVLERASREGK